jgi:hypothetical protein
MPRRHILQLGKVMLPFLPHAPELRIHPVAGYLHRLYLVAVIDKRFLGQKLRVLPIRPEVNLDSGIAQNDTAKFLWYLLKGLMGQN